MDYIIDIFNDLDFKKFNYIELLNEHILDNNLLLFILLIKFLILLALGFSNRVIIFNDGLDFSQTLGIIIIPIIAFFYVEITMPESADNYLQNLHYQKNSNLYFFSLVMSICLIISTVLTSIYHNGIIFGLLVSFFKVLLCSILLILIIGLIVGDNKENKRKRPLYQTVFLLGILGWITSKLINGNAVRKRNLTN